MEHVIHQCVLGSVKMEVSLVRITQKSLKSNFLTSCSKPQHNILYSETGLKMTPQGSKQKTFSFSSGGL